VSIQIVPGFRVLVSSVLLITGCTLLLPSCKSNRGSVTNDTGPKALVVAATPPFATREPERYQAVRIITSSEGSAAPRISKTVIARDGNNRREEYEDAAGERIVYLETPTGRFMLLPSAKLFADVEGFSLVDKQRQRSHDDLSTDLLLNQAPVETRYERLGPENVGERMATKYRVLTRSTTDGTAQDAQTLIWIDETLGMPLRWETTATSGDHETKTTMELSGIRLDIGPQTFELPQDYRKVDVGLMRSYAPSVQPWRKAGKN